MSCDFLHVPISQWSQREGEKFPFFEKLPFFQKLHGVITTLEMVDRRLQRIKNGRLNLGQLTTTFNNPSFPSYVEKQLELFFYITRAHFGAHSYTTYLLIMFTIK